MFRLPKFLTSLPVVAIDLGTSFTKVGVPSVITDSKIVYHEPSLLMADARKKSFTIGREALEHFGKAPNYCTFHRPIKDGLIFNRPVAEKIVRHALTSVGQGYRSFQRFGTIVLSVPLTATPIHIDALTKTVKEVGVSDIITGYQPLFAAVGTGHMLQSTAIRFVVDMGGGTADVSYTLGGTSYGESISAAGDRANEMLRRHFRGVHNIDVDPVQVEQIKIAASDWAVARLKANGGSKYKIAFQQKGLGETEVSEEAPLPFEQLPDKMEVFGHGISDDQPIKITVSFKVIARVLKPLVDEICNTVRRILTLVPAAVSQELLEQGIILTGGGAYLIGLAEGLAKATGLPISIAFEPQYAVIKGMMICAENKRLLELVRLKTVEEKV